MEPTARLSVLLLATRLAAAAWAGPPPKARVFLIGIDGASWNVVNPLLARGRLPNLARLIARGASGPLKSVQPLLSPAIWTSIATGQPPSVHGILGFLQDDERTPVTSADRRSAAVWNVLSHFGRSVCVVGYLKSWPAEPVDGVMVSDHVLDPDVKSGQVYPRDALRGLSTLRAWDPDSPAEIQELRRFIPFNWDPDYERTAKRSRIRYLENKLVDLYLATPYPWDASIARIALFLLSKRKPDFFAIYLRGLDSVSHGFWKFSQPGPLRASSREKKDLGGVIPRYYAYVDELVGRLLRYSDNETVIIVASDHGFGAAQGSPPPRLRSGDHRPRGILIITGGPVRPGKRIRSASVLDLMPTILYLEGAPLARDLPGRVLWTVLPEGYASEHPPRTVASYRGLRPKAQPVAAPKLSEQALESLKAMGYLQ